MDPIYLPRDDLRFSSTITSLAASADGNRLYVGRGLSDDQARENIAVLSIDPDAGSVRGKRLVRDSDRPLPPTYLDPAPRRPRATVSAIVASTRYRKLYLGLQIEDPTARPSLLLAIHDLGEHGDPVGSTPRTYRADVDGFTGGVGIGQLALNPVADALYMTGGQWTALRYYLLDESGEPIGAQPAVLNLGGNAARPTLAVSADGTRLYLGTSPLRLEVLRVEDGVPKLEPAQPGQPPKPLRVLTSAIGELALGGDGYLRFVYSPGALFAVRSLPTLTATTRARPVPLYALPLDEHGDVAPGVADWQRLDGFDHVLLAPDPAGGRLWLARETVAAPPAPAAEPDGFELAAYALDQAGLPTVELERGPKRWTEQPVLASMGAAGQPVVMSRRVGPLVDYAAGEQLRFRIKRVVPGPSPVTFTCLLFPAWGGGPTKTFTVTEGALSNPVGLDEYLAKAPFQLGLWLKFPAGVPGKEHLVEAHYTPADGSGTVVLSVTVRGPDAVFLVPGYAYTPATERPALFERFSDRWRGYREEAEAVALRPDERPDQFVVSAYSMTGGQAHTEQLEDGLATLRALGINSAELRAWQGIPADELAERAGDLSPEKSEYAYAPPLKLPFAFLYDGSITHIQTGKVIDGQFLRGWAEAAAKQVRQTLGVSPGQVVRFQLADEPAWYFPGVLALLDRDDPQPPDDPNTQQPDFAWTDAGQRNAAWIRVFRSYVAANDPDLVVALGDAWPQTTPIGASQATTPALRRLYYWTVRFLIDQATEGVGRMHDELQTAFKAEHAPDPRPEHNRLHVHVNFGEIVDWQWHSPYPNAGGDNNPDSGPDAATGSYDWFRLGAAGAVLPSKHTYMYDAASQVWSFYADLLRSAATPPGAGAPPSFTAMVPGSAIARIGGQASGATYKVAAVIARGAKMLTAYAFGPEFMFRPPNGWAENLGAYAPLADALRLIGRAQHVLYPGRPGPARIAVHLPASSRLWDGQRHAGFYYRDVLPLHTALVHDGYPVDFVDDAGLAAGVLAERDYRVLYLLGPNLERRAQAAVAAWVRRGGTLVALPGAATADEANEPTTLVDDLLGVTGRAGWEPLRKPAHAGTTFGLRYRLSPSDPAWKAALQGGEPLLRDLVNLNLPATPVLADFAPLEPGAAAVVATLAPSDDPGKARPAITRNAVDDGTAYAYAFYPGWQYWCTATHPLHIKGFTDLHTDRLPRYWSDPDRLLATLPVRLAGTPRDVFLSHTAVEARRLQSDQGIAIVLFNWTGEPIESLEVTVVDPGPFSQVGSVRHGPLTNVSPTHEGMTVRLPLAGVDVIMLEP